MDELLIKIDMSKLHIIRICESKLNEDIDLEGLPSNYELLRKDRTTGAGGGLCLIIKGRFRLTPCADLNKFDSGKIERLWLEFKAVMVLPTITRNYSNYPYVITLVMHLSVR